MIERMYWNIFGACFFGILTVATLLIQVSSMGQTSNWKWLVIFAVCFALLYSNYRTLRPLAEKEKEDKKKIEQEKLKVDFYDECVKNGIKSIKKEKEIQKATLIAQKMNLEFTDIAALYAESKQCKDRSEQKKMDEIINSEKAEEQEKCNELTKYANYTGRDKRIAMLGTATMVLPLYGIRGKKGKVTLTGMALFCGSAGTPYRVEFAPERLWAMEQ